MVGITERDPYFDNIKGFAIIIVVLGHALEEYVSDAVIISFCFDFIYSFHMPLLIFISGYFSKDTARCRNNAFTQLLPAYIIFSLAYSFLFRPAEGIKAASLLVPVYALWYLVSLISYRTVWLKFAKSKWIIPLSFLLGILVGFEKVGDELALQRTFTYAGFFMAGYFTEETDIKRLRDLPAWLGIAGIALGAAMVILWSRSAWLPYVFKNNTPYGNVLYDAKNRLLHYLLASELTLSILIIAPRGKTFLTPIGERSMVVYIGHMFAIGALKCFNPFIGRPVLNFAFLSVYSAIAVFVFQLPFASRIYAALMKPFSKLMTRFVKEDVL